MKRIVMWAMSTMTVLVLLFGYHTSTSSRMSAAAPSSAIAPISGGDAASGAAGTAGSSAARSSATGSGSAVTGGSTPGPTSGPTASTSSEPTGGATGSAGTATTVTGSVAQTRWGPVQVELTVDGGRIIDVSVVQYPHENGKDQQINARALPILIDETLSAQSASIDMVSGATVTSEGYVESLQSALDRAGL